MASKTDARIDARTLAALIGDPQGSHPLALGRKVNDKRVRSVARDTVDRFVNRTGYTAHDYTVAEATAIVDAMRSAGRGAPTVSADDARAMLKGRSTASKGRKRASKGQTATAQQDGATAQQDGQ